MYIMHRFNVALPILGGEGYFNKFSQIRICFGDMFPTVLSRGYVQMLLIDEVMCMDAEELSA